MKKYISLRELNRLGACKEAREAFEKQFGKRAALKVVIKWTRKIGKPCWEAWLLYQTSPLANAALANGANIHVEEDSVLLEVVLIGGVDSHLFPLVKLLVDRGINVNAKDGLALYYLLYYGHYDVAEFLLKNGAKLYGWILSDLVRAGKIKSVRFLFDRRREHTVENLPSVAELLSEAARSDKAEMVSLVSRYSEDVCSLSDLNTLFKTAVNLGNFEAAKTLRNYGARIE